PYPQQPNQPPNQPPYGSQQPNQPPYGSQQPNQPQQPASAAPLSEHKGFFKALFDLSFSHFIAIRFASVIFVIAIIVAALEWLFWIILAGVSSQSGSSGALFIILVILFGWIPALVQIIFTRVLLEFLISSIRTAQNTSELVKSSR
ncbi:DUF4282 domain-containing protein, partial [Propionibacterium sp.]|uniref:DUF4282 domain-containing protein n=1 Tax=Propionibacterium sp. TaxID=1977903 RepID=UPI0039ED4427